MDTEPSAFDFKNLFDHHSLPFGLLSSEGKFLYANKSLLTEVGMDKASLMGKPLAFILERESGKMDFSFLNSSFEKKGEHEAHTVKLEADKQKSWKLSLGFNKVQKIFVLNLLPSAELDDSEQKDRIISGLQKEMTQLVYVLAHDVRAPIRAVLGFSQILKEGHVGELSADGQELLELVQENTHKMHSMVNDLVTLSRLSKQEGYLTEVSLEELFVSEFERQSKLTDEPISYQLQVGDLQSIVADLYLMKVIAEELVSNAFKFTSGQELRQFELKGYEQEQGIVFSVKDNGRGFYKDGKELIFNVFHRLVSPDSYEGNGLGLALVKKAVILQGGKVWAESPEEEGATFFVYLPFQHLPK